MQTFQALYATIESNEVKPQLRTISVDELSQGDTIIKVAYSSINYKDMLAFTKNGGVIKQYPIIPGIDLCGEVVESKNAEFRSGDRVIAMGFGIGTTHTGGYAQYARIPSQWLLKLPSKLSFKDSMIFGTAGFSAALSIIALENAGMNPRFNPNILVTGASGGVGGIAIALLKASGYTNIIALTSQHRQEKFLKDLGATQILNPANILCDTSKPLQSQRFSYVLDCVGGDIASNLISQIYYGGAMSLCGNVSGIHLHSNVLPFILRGVSLLGIDSVFYPIEQRSRIWERFASEWNIASKIHTLETSLDNIPHSLQCFKDPSRKGRIIVKL